MSMPKTQAIRAQLRKQAEARQAESDKLTVEQKLARLPATGATKQRARYVAAIEAAKNKPADKVEDKKSKKESKK